MLVISRRGHGRPWALAASPLAPPRGRKKPRCAPVGPRCARKKAPAPRSAPALICPPLPNRLPLPPLKNGSIALRALGSWTLDASARSINVNVNVVMSRP